MFRAAFTATVRTTPRCVSRTTVEPVFSRAIGQQQQRFMHSTNRLKSIFPQVDIIPCATSLGQPRSGVEKGPDAILKGGLVAKLEHEGLKVAVQEVVTNANDLVENDEPTEQGTKKPRSVGRMCLNLHNAVSESQSQKHFSLVLGGDHSLAVGSISAILERDPNTLVIWVDAHGDINTPDSSPTGNIHGMPVAFLSNAFEIREVPGFEWLHYGCLHPNNMAWIGLRDVDGPEKDILQRFGGSAYSMHEVDRIGIGHVMEEILRTLDPYCDRNIHLSFDIDGLDPTHAMSTGTRVPGGLTLREGRYICETLAETGRLRSMDLVEVNPERDPQYAKTTVESAISMISAALGHTLLNRYVKI